MIPEQPFICCCANPLKTSAMVVSSFTRYKLLRLLQICISKKTILPVGTGRDSTEQLDHNKYWIEVDMRLWLNAHAWGKTHVTIIKKILVRVEVCMRNCLRNNNIYYYREVPLYQWRRKRHYIVRQFIPLPLNLSDATLFMVARKSLAKG